MRLLLLIPQLRSLFSSPSVFFSALPFLCFFFYAYGAHRDLHSFPTRRSSDLALLDALFQQFVRAGLLQRKMHALRGERFAARDRSEEHTSELQSRENLVCRLLLEKKNTYEKHRTTQRRKVRQRRPRCEQASLI